jgi:hypothetical protein
MEAQQAHRFTSPLLYEMAESGGLESSTYAILKECPIGKVLRETAWVYDAINAFSYAENGAFNPLDSPTWLQQAMSVVGSEKERCRRMKDEDQKTKRDCAYGKRVRGGRGR